MKRNLLFIGIAVFIITAILYFALRNKDIDDPEVPNNEKNSAPDLTEDVLYSIEKYIDGNEYIVEKLNKSEEFKKQFLEILQCEPAFTAGFGKILQKNDEFDEMVLDFASHFSIPEIYDNLVDYANIRGLDNEKYKIACRILASGGEKALEAIFKKHYIADTGRISDVRDLDKFIQFFPHYYQLKFWLSKYSGKGGNQVLNSSARNAYNNTIVYYSPASMKTQLRLLAETDDPVKGELILWGLAPNRIRPEWYSWFVPMLAEAVSKKNDMKTSLFFRPLVEIFELARRDTLITRLENWLRKHPTNTIGFKHFETAIRQGRTSIERYRQNNSLRTNEITGEDELPDPDAKLLPLFQMESSQINVEIYEKLVEIYGKHASVNSGYINIDPSDYNFESFKKVREFYFYKPYLFEIVQKAKILPTANTWRTKFYKLLTGNEIPIMDFEKISEDQLIYTFIAIQGAFYDFISLNIDRKIELFRTIKHLEKDESFFAKLVHLEILELLAEQTSYEEMRKLIDSLDNEKLTEKQEFSLIQILATIIDKNYEVYKIADFNPFQACVDNKLISDYSNVLNALILQKHKFSEELLKKLLSQNKTNEKLILTIFRKIRNSGYAVMADEVVKFLDSDNPIIIAEAINMLPFSEENRFNFERFINHIDPAVKTAAATKMLAFQSDEKVLHSISILQKENQEKLWENLWRIKKVNIIQPLIIDLAQTDIMKFAQNIKLRSDLLADDDIFSEALNVYSNTDDEEIQANILGSMLTREDKTRDVLLMGVRNNRHRIRKLAWDFAQNTPKLINKELILQMLDADYYKDVQSVLNYLSKNTKWMTENKEIKERVLEFLKQSKEGLEFSAVFALMNIEKDEEIASAFCRAINKRVLWPVSAQVWLYIRNFKNLVVAETMIDIIKNEERNSTDFAYNYLIDVINDFKGLQEKIYKAFDETVNYKSVVEFLPIFVATQDKNAVELLITKDYTKLKEGTFQDDMYLPREVVKALRLILKLQQEPHMQEKTYWMKYVK